MKNFLILLAFSSIVAKANSYYCGDANDGATIIITPQIIEFVVHANPPRVVGSGDWDEQKKVYDQLVDGNGAPLKEFRNVSIVGTDADLLAVKFHSSGLPLVYSHCVHE